MQTFDFDGTNERCLRAGFVLQLRKGTHVEQRTVLVFFWLLHNLRMMCAISRDVLRDPKGMRLALAIIASSVSS
jgi:hypothetical protein